MTTTDFLYTIIACGALALGVVNDTSSRAGESAPSKGIGKGQAHSNDPRADRVAPGNNSPNVRLKGTAPRQFGPSSPQSLKGARPGAITPVRNSVGLIQTASNKTAGAAKVGLTINQDEKYRSLEAPAPHGPLTPNLAKDRRAPGPGSLGGSGALGLKDTAVINGTGMTHRR